MKPIKTIDLGNRHKIGKAFVTLVAEVYPDDSFDIAEVELPSDAERFKSGDLVSYTVMVKASIQPLPFKGSDILGGVWASSDDHIKDAIDDNGMAGVAIDDLRKSIELAKTLMAGFEL